MVSASRKIDFLQDRPVSVFARLCLPLICVNLLQVFTTMLTNALYSMFVGESIFAVIGYLHTATEAFYHLTHGVVVAAWIKTAHYHALYDQQTAQQKTIQALYSVFLVVAASLVLILLFLDPILHAFHVPPSYYAMTRQYFTIWVCCQSLIPFAQLLLMVINGTSSPGQILLSNFLSIAVTAVNAVMLLGICRLGLVGAAMLPLFNAILQILICMLLFRRKGFFRNCRPSDFLPEWTILFSIIRYSLLITLQAMICVVGYLLTGLQANKYLAADYISVLNVSIPVISVMNSIGQACSAFYPQNYGAGLTSRIRQFFVLSNVCVFFYACLCYLIYIVFAAPYYGRLFSDPAVVELGVKHWFWFGTGFIPLGFIYTVRFFFDAVGMSKVSLLSGLGELIGQLIAAFVLIPHFGNWGRSIAYPLGWAVANVFLWGSYLVFRKRIYASCDAHRLSSAP